MRAYFRLDLIYTDWPVDILDALWDTPELPWEQIFLRPYGPAQFEVAIWHERELVAIAVGKPIGRNFALFALEGRPVEISALQGQRVRLILEAVVEYAQMRALDEVRVKPINEQLRNHYMQEFGFEELPDGQLTLHVGTP